MLQTVRRAPVARRAPPSRRPQQTLMFQLTVP